MLSPEYVGPDTTNAEHWKFIVPDQLENMLRKVHSIRILPESSVSFALREAKVDLNRSLSTNDIRMIGEVIEARRVIWGSYQRESNAWKVTLQVMNVSTGKGSKPLSASSSDWSKLIPLLANGIIAELGFVPTEDELNRMNEQPTPSTEALALLGQAYMDSNRGKPLSHVEKTLRSALEVDPKSPQVQQDLAYNLMLQGKLDEATKFARAATEIAPNLASAHYTLGAVYLQRGIRPLAQSEFKHSLLLDADSPRTYVALGVANGLSRKWEEAELNLRKAKQLSPHNAMICAELARAYVMRGERSRAESELRLAERYDTDSDPQTARSLAEVYGFLNDIPAAAKYYEKWLAGAKEARLAASVINSITKKLDELKARLVMHTVDASAPASHTSEDLDRILKDKLTPTEYKSIVNPIAGSAEIRAWAHQLAGDTLNDMEKAKHLFRGLARSSGARNGSNLGEVRTAIDAFNVWSNQSISLTCQDYTHLYIALARSVGLKAFYVFVTKDHSGRNVSHACAMVIINGQAILVDAAYKWFGIPHIKYEVEDDVRVMGAYLCQSHDPLKEDIGLKLVSNWAIPYFGVALNRISRGLSTEAIGPLHAGLKVDSKSAWALFARALVETAHKDWHAAEVYLRQCLALNDDWSLPYYFLGTALYSRGKLSEAREAFRTYLSGETQPRFAAKAREALADINEGLPDLRLGK